MTTNDELREVYDTQYATGYAAAHTPVDTWDESLLIYSMLDWRGKTVLEIGCGEGRLAALIAASLANDVIAVDYSAEAISKASGNHSLHNLCFANTILAGAYDVIVMQGVLEHQDDWRACLAGLVNKLYPGGFIITSSPSFLNPRGYIWQALRLLFGVPMSKTDLHAICPADMQAWCVDNGLDCQYKSCHHDWGAGELLLTDYARRLPKALADAGLPTDGVPRLLEWLKQSATYCEPQTWSGATVVYKVGPKR